VLSRDKGIQFFPKFLAYEYKNTVSRLNIHIAPYLADFLCMNGGKTSSKYSKILAEYISYSSIDKAKACDGRVTGILNRPKECFIGITGICSTSRCK
jgi:hypothetical protein